MKSFEFTYYRSGSVSNPDYEYSATVDGSDEMTEAEATQRFLEANLCTRSQIISVENVSARQGQRKA